MRILCREEGGELSCIEAVFVSYAKDVAYEKWASNKVFHGNGLYFEDANANTYIVPGVDMVKSNEIVRRLLTTGICDLTEEYGQFILYREAEEED